MGMLFIYSLYSITDSVSFSTSLFLKSASVKIEDSLVKTWCEFKERFEAISCVLVYRQYENKTLVVKEYFEQNTTFPVYIPDC